MVTRRIGIIGLGVVGASFLSQLKRERAYIKKNAELDIQIAGLCDIDPRVKKLARRIKVPFTNNAKKLIADPQIDIVVELVGGLHPAKEYIISAF